MKTPGIKSNVQRLKSAVCSQQSVVSRRRAAASGFTLIELMMVIVVILLLSGLLFRLGTIIKNRNERAKATADLANIEHALNEYFAEYGIYPPVQKTAYQYEDISLQPPSMRDSNFTNGVGYDYDGLVAHLYRRDMDNSNGDPEYNPDTARDEAAKDRWYHYLADVTLSTSVSSNSLGSAEGVQVYSNKITTIKDPWDSEYKYESRPPYLSYRLWSTNLD